ncbi:MAG TPA: CBS domain-containing protein [Gemmatimonadaceae bacterium]
MKAREIMTSHPATVTPADPVGLVAGLMYEHDCGCLPVVPAADGHGVLGVVTDRDLALRALGNGLPANTQVGEVMTREPATVSPDASLEDVETLMAERQIRRVLVVDAAGDIMGLIAQADLARAARKGPKPSPETLAWVIERISQPNAVPSR